MQCDANNGKLLRSVSMRCACALHILLPITELSMFVCGVCVRLSDCSSSSLISRYCTAHAATHVLVHRLTTAR